MEQFSDTPQDVATYLSNDFSGLVRTLFRNVRHKCVKV